MTSRRLKSPLRTALAIGIGAHVIGLFLFSFDRYESAQAVEQRASLLFVDLDDPEYSLLAEMVLLRDASPISRPSRWTTAAPISVFDDGWFQDAPVSEMEPRLALLRSAEDRMGIRLPQPISPENLLREMNQRGFLRALNFRESTFQTQPGGTLQVTLESFTNGSRSGLSETFIFDLPETEQPFPNDDIWSPLELRIWIDPLGTIPPPLILNSTGNELRDSLIFEVIKNQLPGLNLTAGYYRLTAGL